MAWNIPNASLWSRSVALEVKDYKWLIWFCSVKPLVKQWWFGKGY